MYGLRLNILLVEDDEDDYILVRFLLSKIDGHWFKLEWVASYEAALEALGRTRHDVYLVDYRLGAHNGLEFIREAAERGCHAPMILLTGQGGREIDVEAMKAGAVDYLVKGQLDSVLLERSIRYAVERARTLEALRRSEERFRAVVEVAPVPMTLTRMSDGVILYANENFGQTVGLPRKDLIGRRMLDFYANPSDHQVLLDELKKRGDYHDRELLFKRSDGPPLWVNTSAKMIAFDEELSMLSGFHDVTERKRAEEARAALVKELGQANRELEETNRKLKEAHMHLVQSEKMASLGQLVAGIAHEINNPLSFILTNIFTVENGLDRIAREVAPHLSEASSQKLEKARARVRDMHTGLEQVKDLVLKLRTFSRLDEGEFKVANIHESIDSVLLFLKHKMNGRIQVEKAYGPVGALACYAGQLNQVLMNIISNAVDAIKGKGKITITTGQEGGMLFISVRDTGKGIPESIRHRIFEPFFTTKPVGQGTGLGLAISYGIVQAHKGAIEVHSQEGEGTEFVIKIPNNLEGDIKP